MLDGDKILSVNDVELSSINEFKKLVAGAKYFTVTLRRAKMRKEWVCASCCQLNAADTGKCTNCGMARPEERENAPRHMVLNNDEPSSSALRRGAEARHMAAFEAARIRPEDGQYKCSILDGVLRWSAALGGHTTPVEA